MKRIYPFVVLAVAAVTLISVAGASTASAAKFVSEDWRTTYINDSGSQYFAKKFGSSPWQCSSLDVSTLELGTKNSEGEYYTDTLSPDEVSTDSCIGASLDWKDCTLTFHPAESEVSEEGSVDIGPPGCGPVVFKFSCEWTIPAQTGLDVDYSNTGGGSTRSISADIWTTNLEYTNKGGNCAQATGTFTNGFWTADLTFEGFDDDENQVGVSEAQLPIGLYMEGLESEEEVDQPRFQAGFETDVDIEGELSSAHEFQVKDGGMTLTCNDGALSSFLAIPGPSLDVAASYGECAKSLGQELTVEMNSCHYVLDVANAGPPYSGTASVECDEEGDKIEFIVGEICTYGLGAQEIGDATYVTEGSLTDSKAVAEVEGNGVTYTRIVNKFFCPAANETGSFSGGFRLGGVE